MELLDYTELYQIYYAVFDIGNWVLSDYCKV